jgi:hypothetical protein
MKGKGSNLRIVGLAVGAMALLGLGAACRHAAAPPPAPAGAMVPPGGDVLSLGGLKLTAGSFTQYVAVLRKNYRDPAALETKVEGFLRTSTEKILLAHAATLEGLDRAPEVVKQLQEYERSHLINVFLQEKVNRPAAELAAKEKDQATQKRRTAWERERLQKEIRALARQGVRTEVFPEAIAAALEGKEENPVVGTLEGKEVRFEIITKALSTVRHPSSGPSMVGVAASVLDAHFDGEGLVMLARKEKFDTLPAYLDGVANNRVKVLSQSYLDQKVFADLLPGEEEITAYYREKAESFRRGREKAIHEILLEDLETARLVRERLGKGDDFLETVAAFSKGPTREAGGFVGYLMPGESIPVLDQTIQQLQPRQYSEIVRTIHGFHILWNREEVEGRLPPLGEVREAITATLSEAKRRAALAEVLRELHDRYRVTRNDNLIQELRSTR